MYSYKFGEGKFGKSRLEGIDASFKDLAAVCSNVRGKKTSDALALLEKAADGTMPIHYRKYNSKLAHRRELGGKQGRYPKKAAKFVLAALKSAMGSAKAKGMSEDLVITHIAANKRDVFPRLSPKGGKRTRSYYETGRVEVVVIEAVESKKGKDAKKAEKGKEKKASAVVAPTKPAAIAKKGSN